MSVKEEAKSTAITGSTRQVFGSSAANYGRNQLSNLPKLEQLLANTPREHSLRDTVFYQPLELDSLEMLEAELINQGLLPQASPSDEQPRFLARQATLEASSWRWRAKRLGAKYIRLGFRIDVPRYVLHLASELRAQQAIESEIRKPLSSQVLFHKLSLYQAAPIDSAAITEKLEYLDRFAFFLTTNANPASNRYQQGLNLVLRVLSSSRAENLNPHQTKLSDKQPAKAASNNNSAMPHALQIVLLPTSKEAFDRKIRKS